jgi:hypothetical protein
MGAKLTMCTTTPPDATKPSVTLPSGTKPPNFMKKIALTCLNPSTTDQSQPTTYSAAIEYDWGIVVPIGLAILLVIILIGYLVMKTRHHPAPAMIQE